MVKPTAVFIKNGISMLHGHWTCDMNALFQSTGLLFEVKRSERNRRHKLTVGRWFRFPAEFTCVTRV